MKIKQIKLIAGLASVLFLGTAEASHYRGGTLVGSITNNVLTVQATTFWRPTFVDSVSLGGGFTQTATSQDTSDSRYTVTNQTFTRTLNPGFAQTIDFGYRSCCRVSGVPNTSSSFGLNSRIVWDGSSNTAPILFDFSSIQPEVLRGANYSDNLGATSGDGLSLSYSSVLTTGMTSQAPGLVIDSNTGQLTIPASDTANYTDNTTGNIGADVAFAGRINASNGSYVTFDWMFDGVGTLSNRAPNVNDVVINALVGNTVQHTMTGSDPDGDPLTWSISSFFGPGGASLADVSFNPMTQLFTFNSSGFVPGTYIANIKASDGSLTDTGTITINLSNPPTGNNVPEPSVLLMLMMGLFGVGFYRKK